MIRVLIVDDQALVRGGLAAMLDAQADIQVVGEAEDGGAAVDEALRLRPDVVLMDVRMPKLDGIEATKRLVAHPGRRRGCSCSPPSTWTSTSSRPCAPAPAASC